MSINGQTVHLLDNEITVPQPERVPLRGFAWDAVFLGPHLALAGAAEDAARGCSGNVIARNRIEGHRDGIIIVNWHPPPFAVTT